MQAHAPTDPKGCSMRVALCRVLVKNVDVVNEGQSSRRKLCATTDHRGAGEACQGLGDPKL